MNREQWLEWRKEGIGASDVAPIVLGDVFGRGPLDVYLEKRGLVPPQIESADMRRGNKLETLAAQRLAERPEFEHLVYPTDDEQRFSSLFMRSCGTNEWARCSLDAYLREGEADFDGNVPVEIKCPRMSGYLKAKEEGPETHQLLQVQWQLMITGAEHGFLVVFHSDPWDLLVFPVQRDNETIAAMTEACKLFWFDHVVPGIPPEPASAPAWVPPPKAKPVERTDDAWVNAVCHYLELEATYKRAETDRDAAKAAIIELLAADGIDAAQAAGAKVTYYEQAGRTNIDRKLMLAHGVDPTRFETQGKPYRVLRCTRGKEKAE